MKIFIPTLGRPDEQLAYQQLVNAGAAPILVVDETEQADYTKFRHVRVSVVGIAAKRQAILEMAAGEKFAMFDDEMTINRVDFVDGKCVIAIPTPRRVAAELNKAERLLDKFAHGGVHTRHFVNYAKQPYETNRGYIRGGLGFFNPALMPKVPRFEGNSAEDVRFMIGLLRQGLDYFLLTSCCMVEVKSKTLRSHWTQEEKNADMRTLADENKKYARATKDGRLTLTYAGILKDAKKQLSNQGVPQQI